MRFICSLFAATLLLGALPHLATGQERAVAYQMATGNHMPACLQVKSQEISTPQIPGPPKKIRIGTCKGDPRPLDKAVGHVAVADAAYVQERLEEVQKAVTNAVKDMSKLMDSRLRQIDDLQKEVNALKETVAKLKLGGK